MTYKGEIWRVLAQQSGEDSLSLDPLLLFEHIAIHEAVQHGGVGMDVNVELQTHFLMVGKKEREREDQTNRKDEAQQVSREGGYFSFCVNSGPHWSCSTGNTARPVSWLQLPGGCCGQAFTHGTATNSLHTDDS